MNIPMRRATARLAMSAISGIAVVIALAGVSPSASAQSATGYCVPDRQISSTRERGLRWLARPSVLVLARADDPRIALVREGVTFWNDLFARQGSGFRFGPVTVVPPQAEITAWLPRGAAAVLAGEQGQPADTPAALAGYCGQVVIALADANFVSYTKFLVASGAVVTGIRGLEHAPLDRPNVARNVILHQLGHAVGLRHNDIPQTLMCGRPAPCRSDRFEAATPKLFSLNAAERRELSAKYPSDWPKSANARKTARDP